MDTEFESELHQNDSDEFRRSELEKEDEWDKWTEDDRNHEDTHGEDLEREPYRW